MAKTLYFNGEIELTSIYGMENSKFTARFPEVTGRKYDGYAKLVGRPITETPIFVQGQGWTSALLPVERVINFKSNPSRHECDARCINASGRVMNCECKCGGKNHGRGAFNCSAVPA